MEHSAENTASALFTKPVGSMGKVEPMYNRLASLHNQIQCSLCIQWVANNSLCLHVLNEDYVQTGR